MDATADLSGNAPTFAIRLIHGGDIQTRDLRLLPGSGTGTGTTELVFVYTVDTDDNERAGLSALSNNLSSDGQIVSSASGVPAVRDHDGVPLQQGHKVNGALTEGDARLSALSLSGITLDQAFEPSRNEYTASTTAARTTLAYTELTNRAIVISRYISPSDAAIADLGHQVDLVEGVTVISVWVDAPLCGSEDVCRAHRIYTITVTRAAARSDLPPPRNLRAVEEKGAVKLNWDAPDDDATVTGYRIERRLADGLQRDNHTLVEDTGSSETGYTDQSAEKGVEYEYRVSARNEDGAGEASGWVSAAPDEEPVAGEDVAVMVGDHDGGVGLPGLRVLFDRHQEGRVSLSGLIRGGRHDVHREDGRNAGVVDVHRRGPGASLRLRAGVGRGAVCFQRCFLQFLQLRQHL